jgi:hypothetical protein
MGRKLERSVRSKRLGLNLLNKAKIKARLHQRFVGKSAQSGWTEYAHEDDAFLSVAGEPLESWLESHTP